MIARAIVCRVMASATDIIDAAKTRIFEVAGGSARLQIIAVLAAVLGLDTAQLGTLSAVSDRLKDAFDIGNTQIGLLLAVTSFIGAIATLPMGILADRMRRQTILIVAVLIWAAAMILSGTATSYFYLLGTRLFLGAVTAVAWPCAASLNGDFFPARDRASIYGLILSGELIGAGVGFFVAGEVSSFVSWRWAFFVMASPSIVLAWVLWRFLPEPERGGQSWLEVGEDDPEAASRPSNRKEPGAHPGEPDQVQQKVREARISPRKDKIIRENPTGWSWWRAMVYLLRLPTYSLLIVASTLAYFFFSGARLCHYLFPAALRTRAQHRQRARYYSRRWRARGSTGRRTNIAASSRQRQHQRPDHRAGDCTVSFGAVPCDRHLAVDPVDRDSGVDGRPGVVVGGIGADRCRPPRHYPPPLVGPRRGRTHGVAGRV